VYYLPENRSWRKQVSVFIRFSRSLFLIVLGLFLLGTTARAQNDGAALFKAKCAPCHGPDGKGETPMGKAVKARDLGSDEVQKESDAQFTETISNGKGKMPAYKGKLTDDQIKQLVSFIRTLKKK
jgi:cytochrome c6